jgi:hypothetical protein
MSFFGGLFGGGAQAAGEGVKAVFEGAGGLATSIRSAITGDMPPEVELKLRELEASLNRGQQEINKIEAASGSLFVAGWRPAIGWICAASLGFYYIPQYIVATVLWVKVVIASGVMQPYPVTSAGLMELVFAVLGMAGLRSAEKMRGSQANH